MKSKGQKKSMPISSKTEEFYGFERLKLFNFEKTFINFSPEARL